MVMRTTDAERRRLYDAAPTRAEVDLLQAQFIAEDAEADLAKRLPQAPAQAAIPQVLIEAVGSMFAEDAERIADLETRLAKLEAKADAAGELKAITDQAERKWQTRVEQLSLIAKQLDALLQPSATGRRSAAARLRQ